MTGAEREEWQDRNDQYLAAALEWLRLLLHRRIAEAEGKTAGVKAAGSKAGGKARGEVPDSDDALSAAWQAMERAAAAGAPPALAGLGRLLALSPFEQHTLLLCAAPELDPGVADLCARAQGDAALPFPTFALALSLLPGAAWDVLSPYRGLRYWKLVEVDRSAGQALVTSPLCADERIVNHLRGLDYLDDRLEPLVTPVSPEAAPADPAGPPASRRVPVDEAVAHWRQPAGPGGRLPVIQLLGPDSEGKRSVAARTAEATGHLLYRLPAAQLPEAAADLDTVARLWQREALLLPLALLLDMDDEAGESATGVAGRVRRFLDRSGGPCMVATRESRPELAAVTAGVDIAPPPPGERAAAWRTVLPPEEADRLAGQFALDLPTIHEITTAHGPDAEAAWHACRARTRPRLGSLAQRLEPRVGWEDIVLPAQETGLLRQVADQVAQRNTVYQRWGFGERIRRGLGISVLFTGPSGTGKTMAAEVLARHLRLDLYRVDLSAAVSKYIGETEKNLRRLFDAAEPGGAILLFDEADALFGKRSDVKDSHDRYANIEVSYLLQRMEAYRGLAILATNQRRALDTAFLRRLRFIVPFGFPGPDERRAMWQRAFPPHAPVDGLDADRLAALPLSGGMIRNIALNAAFAAASAGAAIGMPMVLAAARAELRKLEMPLSEADFAWDGQQGMPEMSA